MLEPSLQPIVERPSPNLQESRISDGARLDIATSDFWGGRFEKCFLDIRVLNPHNKTRDISAMYSAHEKEERGNMKRESLKQNKRRSHE